MPLHELSMPDTSTVAGSRATPTGVKSVNPQNWGELVIEAQKRPFQVNIWIVLSSPWQQGKTKGLDNRERPCVQSRPGDRGRPPCMELGLQMTAAHPRDKQGGDGS